MKTPELSSLCDRIHLCVTLMDCQQRLRKNYSAWLETAGLIRHYFQVGRFSDRFVTVWRVLGSVAADSVSNRDVKCPLWGRWSACFYPRSAGWALGHAAGPSDAERQPRSFWRRLTLPSGEGLLFPAFILAVDSSKSPLVHVGRCLIPRSVF